jgi:hypothetical protein
MAPFSLRQVRHALSSCRTDDLQSLADLALKSESLTADSFAAMLLNVHEVR